MSQNLRAPRKLLLIVYEDPEVYDEQKSPSLRVLPALRGEVLLLAEDPLI